MKRKLLDTDILSYYLKGVPSVVERAERYLARLGRLEFGTVAYYEIRQGLLHAGARAKVRESGEFALASTTWPFDRATARLAADPCAALWRQGLSLDGAGVLIAATAMTNGLVLVTNNRRHSGRIAGLEIEDWLEGGQ